MLNEESATLSEEQWKELSSFIEQYNKYVEFKLKTIMDFDIWFEHTTSKDFPREWYSMIRESGTHK